MILEILDVPQVGFDDSMTGFEWSMRSCADRTMSSYCRTTGFDERHHSLLAIPTNGLRPTRDLGFRVKSYDT